MTRAFVALGSNIDPERHVPAAVDLLRQRLDVVGVSSFYRSPALGRTDQPPFWNGVVEVRTELEPRELKFDVLRPIESQLGRSRGEDRYAPRTIDLDLLLLGERVIDEPDLVLPDPEIGERPFLAVPLHELAPDLVLPGSGARLADLVARLGEHQLLRVPAGSGRQSP